MKIFAIGDLHLSFDKRVEKPMDIFGEQWAGHAERLKENWLKTVSEDDTVIICGDISWGIRLEEAEADFEWIRALPGKKLLFKGNHDLWWPSAAKLNKLYGDEKMIFVQNGAVLVGGGETGNAETSNAAGSRKKIAVCGSRGWICPGSDGFTEEDERIYRRELLRLEMSLKEGEALMADEIVAALHFPPTNDKHQASEFTRLLSRYGVKVCVYGHLHGGDAFKNGPKGIFNGVRYELVSLDYLEASPKEVTI